MADFHHQQAAFVEMRRRKRYDRSHELEAIVPARERQRGFAPVFGWQAPHRRVSHVRGVGYDHVVAPRPKRAVEIGAHEFHPSAEPVVRDISPRDVQRLFRDIRAVDARMGKRERKKNREAARTGAQIQGSSHPGGSHEPRCEVVAQKLGDVRARDDHAFVHVEAVLAQPRFVREIRRGLARADALVDECGDAAGFLGVQRPVEMWRELVERKAERVQDEPRRFVTGVRRPVTE